MASLSYERLAERRGTRASLIGALVVAAVVFCAQAAALADDSASVVNDVVVVQGDGSANAISFTDGASVPSNGTDYGAEVWDTNPGASVSAGSGCVTGNDQGGPPGSAPAGVVPVFCGSSSVNSIAIEGNGGDDSIGREPSSYGFGYEQPLKSILIDGGDGNDTIGICGSFSSCDELTTAILDGGNGDDTIDGYFAPNPIAIDGGPGADHLTGGDGADTIHGGDGNDYINGSDGDDHLFGDAGNDTIYGGAGNDTLTGGPGNNSLTGDTGSSYLNGFGNDTLNAVNGQADRVLCGFGADVATVDQYDTVSQCATVHRTTVASGRATPKPSPVAYKSHCARHHGRRVCTAPKPLNHHTYTGNASQGQAITVTVDSNGRYVTFELKSLRFSCADGTGGSEDVELTTADRQRISRNGTFSSEIDYYPGGGYSHEVVYVVGAFDGHRARGAVVGNTQIAGHGECTTSKVTWSADG